MFCVSLELLLRQNKEWKIIIAKERQSSQIDYSRASSTSDLGRWKTERIENDDKKEERKENCVP